MARNEEKAQSMLYRFREAQAAELGLGTRGDRRPRMASACKSMRECERWRGEILREISRKVSKIQDAGLTEYEVRDLNDEINKLLREKRHWENQIIALGGANYRRNVAMLDADGKEVPGTKGYKYFGRAKDLPGVRELFQSKKNEEEEENQALAFYKKFMGQGPAYYGDVDEADEALLEYERNAEEEEWADAFTVVREALGLPETTKPPPVPPSTVRAVSGQADDARSSTKRKADADGDTDMAAAEDDPKRSKTESGAAAATTTTLTPADPAYQHAQAAASYIPFLTTESLLPPTLPSRTDMEELLLDLRKKALVEEYFGQ
ncbi:Isy1-like splicing factor [Schizophyllum amplum]|uniref:Isy1-like splicing factor n=1 Tax=Schizophyllum amplum TaxID=97359 RepID=A0A550CGL2_9AGAR|nr:Isy1-like splicing factor [Auriculariopsis ampla]